MHQTAVGRSSDAEIEGDRNALTAAAIGQHLVHQPGRKDYHAAGLGAQPFGGARRQRSSHSQVRRIHHRERPARIEEFELATQRRIGIDAAIVDIVDARPVGARVRVETIAIAVAIDVRPHVADPGHGNMWANINRNGDGNGFHSHPGAYWSGVYYVDDGGIDADPALGGELEFLDPRGPLAMMNAPHLRMAGALTAGATERLRPKAGRMVIFPAWLMHQVLPYRGGRERISIAFNLCV